MKTGIHPKYYPQAQVTCSCGAVYLAGSTIEKFSSELCSACHPFYTGQNKLVDTAGKVDKFMARVKKAQEFKEKMIKKVDEDDDDVEEIKEEIAENTVEAEIEVKEETEKVEEKKPATKKAPAKKPAAKKTTKKA